MIEASRRFELIGFRAEGDAGIEVRARGLDGRWSDWLAATAAHGHGPDSVSDGHASASSNEGRGQASSNERHASASSNEGRGHASSNEGRGPDSVAEGHGHGSALTDPVWTGPAHAFEIRAKRPLGGARAVLVDPGRPASSAAAKRYVATRLPAGPGQPRIIARSSWATAACRPRVAAGLGAIQLAFVHHTVNSNAYGPGQSAGMIRAICLFHKYGNGWNDIGYNFVVDRYGQVFEARAGGVDEAVVGAQAGGYNLFSTGVALLGNFSGVGPSRKTFDSLARLVAWKLSLHGVAIPGAVTVQVSRDGAPYSRYRAGAHVRLNRIAGHRDADTTTCPGTAMYRQLPRLRQAVRRLAPNVGALTLVNQATAPGSVTVAGSLADAGAPVAGATVEVQRRSTAAGPRTLATATTDQNGDWAVGVPLPKNAELRAICRGDAAHPAIVSAGLVAIVPPVIALIAATTQAPPGSAVDFSGSVTPAKSLTSIVISQQQIDGTFAPVRTIRVHPGRSGAFARAIGFADPGQYQVVAHTAADVVNGPGSSAPVSIVIA